MAGDLVNADPVMARDGTITRIIITFVDITGRRLAERITLARLRLIQFASTHTLDELLEATLNEAEALSDSIIGFYHFLEADQRTLSLQSWSTRTKAELCKAEGKGSHYDVSAAGVWVECIHERCPVIHNDYQTLPHRKGMPPGHAPVIRELVVPVLRGDNIVAVLGVGNKARDYTRDDVDAVSRLADLAWDITELKRAEEQKARFTRALRMLSEASETMIRTSDEAKLLDEICRIIVEIGGYRLAWVGFADKDGDKTLRPVAYSGTDSDYMRTAKITWGDDPRGRGPGGTAIRSGQPCIMRDLLTNPSFVPWREEAIRRGFKSIIGVPLVSEDETLGAIGIYSDLETAFEPSEVGILRELAGDLAFGITALRTRDARQRAESELRLYRQLTNQTNDAIFVVDPETSRILDVNETACRMLGYARQELLALSVLDFDAVIPSATSWAEKVKTIRQNTSLTLESRHRRKCGETFPVELGISITVQDGREYLIAVGRDITERKRTESALEESREKMRSILENVGIGVALISPKMEVLELNQRMRNWFPTVEPAQNPICYRAFNDPPRDTVCDYCPTARTLRDGLVHESTTRTPQAGGVRNYRIVSSPVRSASGEISAATEMVEDITDKLSLEAQLQQAQKMEAVGQLAGGVAHDFNNKLAVIIGYAELMLQQMDSSHPFFEEVREIHEAAERSAELTRQLLAFARKQAIIQKVLDLNEVVDGMLKMLRRLIGEDISLTWMPGSGLWSVHVDPSQVDQILANLCVNARDAIGGVGRISIETSNAVFDERYCSSHPGFLPGEHVLLSVSDNGCGMDEQTLARIFEPFFTTKETGKGTGLGLATVYGIVRQNDGFCEVRSVRGKGSSFRIYLPRHIATTEAVAVPSKAPPATRGHETILLVEDEASILGLAKRVLERLGYRVLAAATPTEAIRLASVPGEEIHLLLTDVIMPEMNGLELREALAPLCPEIRHLYMSGHADDAIALRTVVSEGMHFIQKPFSIEVLATKVREALG